MRKYILLCAVVFFLGTTVDTFAQGRRDRWRIRQGVYSGRITRDEARALRERRRQIWQERRAYRSDGRLSREERRELRRDRREYDRLIRRESRDNDWRDGYSNRRYHRRGNGYYRRGAGSATHPVFGSRNRQWRRNRF